MYNYRTLLIFIIMLIWIISSGLSGQNPFKRVFFMSFMAIITPAMFLIIAVTHKDYGYDFLHRIMGEYKLNFFYRSVFKDFQFIWLAFFDAIQFSVLYFICWIKTDQSPRSLVNDHMVEADSFSIYNLIVIATIVFIRLLNRNFINIQGFLVVFVLFCIALMFVMEDTSFDGITDITDSP